ncbi:aspartate/glutamate racemase family protein [Aspergillus aculeatinus CBS 121060]|uniref:Aspartate racemase n=1 Tax=Aspergillus aculeatinus CBS 121060 TaxID=1448322 RepID=A0ACD1GWQ1_9EURO|nr:aspartate racemase [Aspergillus aculeatinus CBS 121060]RAH65896.1 aspartate racemase [Aspergillus aculeatinus CBS 121060]
MKRIGIVGGIAWPSSMVYYRRINEYYRERTDSTENHTPRLVMIQTDFALIEKAQKEGDWDQVGRILAGEAQKLKAAGADFFLLACNTVHTAAEYIMNNVDLPMLHIVDAAARKVVEGGVKTVGLLGSRYTMTGTYFVGRLQQQYGLNVLVAEGQHQTNVHDALYGELASNVFRDETRAKFRAAIADLIDRGAELVILGCTESGMLVDQSDSEVPIIDTSIVHAQAAVDLALSGN